MVFWDPGVLFWPEVFPSYEVLPSRAMSSLGSDEVYFKFFWCISFSPGFILPSGW